MNTTLVAKKINFIIKQLSGATTSGNFFLADETLWSRKQLDNKVDLFFCNKHRVHGPTAPSDSIRPLFDSIQIRTESKTTKLSKLLRGQSPEQ